MNTPRFPHLNSGLKRIAQATRQALGRGTARGTEAGGQAAQRLWSARRGLTVAAALAGGTWLLVQHPPLQQIGRGEVGVRTQALSGASSVLHEGPAWVLPGLQQLRRYPLRDTIYHPEGSARADGPAPFQSVEGLSIGVDLAVRYALDPAQVASASTRWPEDIGRELVQPAIQGVVYQTFSHYTVREIFSTKRAEIQARIEAELRPRLAADGVLLRSVQIGQVDLPADYRRGMDQLLSEELATEKMRYTLALKEKQVEQTALEAEAAKVRREKDAEAAAREQVIAARAQEEAMKHVLPFKQKQIEQRALEAEAEKAARIKSAEASAQARRVESQGEADARQKLADAEVYRLQKVGQVSAEQMAREGALISRHPLLIQKTLADKLSDKVQVIIAPPPANGDFIGATLLGSSKAARATPASAELPAESASEGEVQ